jgi:nucleoid-associated protein YgaU
MLTLRKDMKVGAAIGAAVLGVAAVYGAMSLLTNRGDDQQADAGGIEQVSAESGKSAGPDVVVGLPPENATAETTNSPTAPQAQRPAAPSNADPFAESARTDGITSDPWTAALTTGRVPSANKGSDVLTTRTPDTIKPESKTTTGETARTISSFEKPAEGARTDATDANKSPKPTPVPAMGEGTKYTIAPGDTFSSIAGKVYGDRNLYHSIVKANPGVDPGRLKVGMEIILPPVETVKNERGSLAAPARAETGAIDTATQYRVQPGDTLHTISKKLYNRTSYWMAIYDLNKAAIGSDAGKLKVGTVLTLPQRPTITR